VVNTDKQAALWTIEQLPDDASLDDSVDALRYTQSIRRRIQRGIQEIDEGKTIPHDEVVRELTEWLQSVGQTMPDGTSTRPLRTSAGTRQPTRRRSANASV